MAAAAAVDVGAGCVVVAVVAERFLVLRRSRLSSSWGWRVKVIWGLVRAL